MKDVKAVIEINDGVETVYNVTAPLSCKFMAQGFYMLVWSTKPTFQQQIEKILLEQNRAIDDILVTILEG